MVVINSDDNEELNIFKLESGQTKVFTIPYNNDIMSDVTVYKNDYNHYYIDLPNNNASKKYVSNCIKEVFVKYVDDAVIPNTVLKTTPQTLTDTDKNQALANLGIDPVVWKYLCTPCIIKYGEKVPEELIGEFNEDVGESGGYELKYPYSGMYRIGIKEYSTEDDIDYNIIINPGTVNKYCLIMDYIWTPKNIAAGSIWINSDKKWDNDAF